MLAIAAPLILSQMSFTIQTSVDRILLTWHSPEAVAGATTAVFVTYVLTGLFIGTGEYLTAFVAQYHGAGRPRRIGPAMWQGIYFTALAGALSLALSPLMAPLFELAGHAPLVRRHEITFSRILLAGTFPVVLNATLASFFSGRGQTRVVLLVNLLATALNVVLDYLWIFGRGGWPAWGVAGAAWATVVSQSVAAGVMLALMLRRGHRAAYATLSGWRLEPPLLRRLLRHGLPSGAQFSVEILAFSAFMLIVGRIGTDALAASGIAFNLNMIVFLPMLGLGVGVSSLVGRFQGGGRPGLAERATWSAFWMSLAYMGLCGCAYVLAPRALLAPYAAGADPAAFAGVEQIAVVLLRFVALYSIFDMMNVVFAAGLKGAGDTVYPMAAVSGLAWGVMLPLTYVACVSLGAGVYTAWWAVTVYVVCLGLLMLRRFRSGRWKALRVIEAPAPPAGDAEPEPA